MFRPLLIATLLVLAGFALWDAARPSAALAPPPMPVEVRAPDRPGAGAGAALVPIVEPGPASTATPALDMFARLAVRRRLVREGDRIYLDSLLAHTDSVLTRWVGRSVLRVALIADTTVRDWTPALLDEGRGAIQAWDAIGSGLTLLEVTTADSADITVRWVRILPDSGQVGTTSLTWDSDGVVRSAGIQLALRRNTDSVAVPAGTRLRVATHELGHALGLPHSNNADDIMYHTAPVSLPSSRDQATLRLLYAVPPGPLRVQP